MPGLEDLDKSVYFINITYPRFLSLPAAAKAASGSDADLLLELRVGRSGLGDDWLYSYTPNEGWSQVGKYLEVCSTKLFWVIDTDVSLLKGVNSEPYFHG